MTSLFNQAVGKAIKERNKRWRGREGESEHGRKVSSGEAIKTAIQQESEAY